MIYVPFSRIFGIIALFGQSLKHFKQLKHLFIDLLLNSMYSLFVSDSTHSLNKF